MSDVPRLDFDGIARTALRACPGLLEAWFPAGRQAGREFYVGNLRGERGESLRVNLDTGLWSDFSTGEGGRDLVALYAAREGINNGEAARQLAGRLGLAGEPSADVIRIGGDRKGPEWQAMMPVPDTAPPPPTEHPRHGAPKHVAVVRAPDGRPLHLIKRFETSPGEKVVVPQTYGSLAAAEPAWHWKAPPAPRPLYGLDLLAMHQERVVLVVEGEAKRDAAQRMLADRAVVVSWPNGADGVKRADWAPLRARDVVIWPDNDPPGHRAAQAIAAMLGSRARVVEVPDSKPDHWDLADAEREGWTGAEVWEHIKPTPTKAALWTSADLWVESAIPKRPWVAPGYLLRGSVTGIGGPGSGGKSSLLVAHAVALALGRRFGGFEPASRFKVLTYNVEDDDNEQRRRFSAALRQFDASPADLRGQVIRCGPTTIGTLIDRDPATGLVRFTQAWEELEKLLEAERPDVVMLDPLVELHTAEENDNTALRAVIAHLRALAQRHNCAVVLVHHTRKGGVAGDMDSLRGASAIVGAARVVLTVATMTPEEAEKLQIAPDLRRRFFRLDGAKSNYAPADSANWHELVAYELDNGDLVAAAVPWTPPSGRAGTMNPEAMALVAAAVERGSEQGPYSPRLAPAQPRSVAAIMAQHGIKEERDQKAGLRQLLAWGFTVQDWTDARSRTRDGLRAPNGAPKAPWVNFGAEPGGE